MLYLSKVLSDAMLTKFLLKDSVCFFLCVLIPEHISHRKYIWNFQFLQIFIKFESFGKLLRGSLLVALFTAWYKIGAFLRVNWEIVLLNEQTEIHYIIPYNFIFKLIFASLMLIRHTREVVFKSRAQGNVTVFLLRTSQVRVCKIRPDVFRIRLQRLVTNLTLF